MSYCKEFLKAFRKTVGAKPEEKIDKRYKPYLAPNDKYYDRAHCGYCAEVEYLDEIYSEKEKQEKKVEIKKIEYSLRCWKSRLDYLEKQVYYTSAIIAKWEKKLKKLKEEKNEETNN